MDCKGRLKSLNGQLLYKNPHTCSDVVKCELNKAISDLQAKVIKSTDIPIETLYEQQRKEFQLLGLLNVSFPDLDSLKDDLLNCEYPVGNVEDSVDEDATPKKTSKKRRRATAAESELSLGDETWLPVDPQDEEFVNVQWNNYVTNFNSTIPNLLQDEKFVDVTLACGGNYLKCHKVILGACSSYFEELLSANPCQHPIILMRDFEFWEVQAVVEFIYKGVVNVTQDKLCRLLQAAEILKVKGMAGTEKEMVCDEKSSPVVQDLQPEIDSSKNKKRKAKSLPAKGKSLRSKKIAMGSPSESPEKVLEIFPPMSKHSQPKNIVTGIPTNPVVKLLKISSPDSKSLQSKNIFVKFPTGQPGQLVKISSTNVALKTKPFNTGKENSHCNQDSTNLENASVKESLTTSTVKADITSSPSSSGANLKGNDAADGSVTENKVPKEIRLLRLQTEKLERELKEINTKLEAQQKQMQQQNSSRQEIVSGPLAVPLPVVQGDGHSSPPPGLLPHHIQLLPHGNNRKCFVCRKRSNYWCPQCCVGVHKKCEVYLVHVPRGEQRGGRREPRKRNLVKEEKESGSESDSD